MWQPQGIYNEYELRTPVLLVGDEAILGLYNYPGTRIAIIHGKSFSEFDLLRNCFSKKEVSFFLRSWNGEPDLEGLKGTIRDLEEYSPDVIIAIGGGSVIDGAKLCRLFLEAPYFTPGVTRLDGSILKTKFIAIPTTVGSGAEISSAAVYIDNDHKEMVVLHELQPEVIVYDKRYVKDASARLLCASAMDAMAHVIEGYISNIQNSVMEIKAEEALRILRIELTKYINGSEMDLFRLQYAGYLGGIIQNHCIVGANHAFAHQMSKYGFSHGEAVALMLIPVIRLNSRDENTKARYHSLFANAGFEEMESLFSLIDSVCDKSGINNRKKELRDILFDNESDSTFYENIINDRSGKGNPIQIDNNYIKELIRSI